MANTCPILLFLSLCLIAKSFADKKVHYVHWNKANPMFSRSNDNHVLEVNNGNEPWEYDQVNIICPVNKIGSRYPETHVIYSVSKEEYNSCRITNPKPKIVAICNRPYNLIYFTITFRSFTPTPGGLEFKPGHDYYFISTSSQEDLHRRVGGGCSTHNMKMIFKVANSNSQSSSSSTQQIKPLVNNYLQQNKYSYYYSTSSTTTIRPTTYKTPRTTRRSYYQKYNRLNSGSSTNSGSSSYYFYRPHDLAGLEDSLRQRNHYDYEMEETNEIWTSRKNKALKYQSNSSSKMSFSILFPLIAIISLKIAFL